MCSGGASGTSRYNGGDAVAGPNFSTNLGVRSSSLFGCARFFISYGHISGRVANVSFWFG
jgi:hypothetical protein